MNRLCVQFLKPLVDVLPFVWEALRLTAKEQGSTGSCYSSLQLGQLGKLIYYPNSYNTATS